MYVTLKNTLGDFPYISGTGTITLDNSWISFTPIYNSDRYELVEKKDWKVKNLKSQIEAKKSKIENLDNIQINLIEQVKKAKDELKELEKELKNIE